MSSSVTTSAATNITSNGARLHGSWSGTGGNVWFVYGYSAGYLPYSTGQYGTSGSGGSWYWDITGLPASTTIYFQAEGYSFGFGSVLSFTTSAGSSTGPPLVTTSAATSIGPISASINGSINPNGLYTTYNFEIGTDPTFATGFVTGTGPLSAGNSWDPVTSMVCNANGLQLVPNTLYYFFLRGFNPDGDVAGGVLSFTSAAIAPSATTSSATSISPTSATLNGNVTDNGLYGYGGPSTSCTFLLSGSPSGGTPVGASTSPFTGTVGENVNLTGLTPNTTYYFQIVASNSNGSASGSWVSFTTLAASAPTVNTDAATSIGATTATLQGDLNPNGFDTQGYFQWGTTTAYGNTTSNQDQGSGTSDVGFSQALTGLTTGATYHYRAVGTNIGGTNYGADAQFTVGLPSTTLSTPTRGYTTYFGTFGVTFVFAYVNNGATGAQLDYSLAVTNPAGTTYYWTGSAWSLSPTPWVTSSSGSITISAAQWSATFPSPGVYYWTAATQDANGKSAYAAQQSIINQGFSPPIGQPVHFIEDVTSGVPARTMWLVWSWSGQLVALGESTVGTVEPFSQWRNLSYNSDNSISEVS